MARHWISTSRCAPLRSAIGPVGRPGLGNRRAAVTLPPCPHSAFALPRDEKYLPAFEHAVKFDPQAVPMGEALQSSDQIASCRLPSATRLGGGSLM